MENETNIPEIITPSNVDYLKPAITKEEIMEEMSNYLKDLNQAQFTATFDIRQGMELFVCANLQVFQDLIERCEELSPNPDDDPYINKMYEVYDALELIKNKCSAII